MSWGGKRRRHVPPKLSPEQCTRAAERIEAGELVKWVCLDLGVVPKTLANSFARCGIKTHGRPGLRPLKPVGKQQGVKP